MLANSGKFAWHSQKSLGTFKECLSRSLSGSRVSTGRVKGVSEVHSFLLVSKNNSLFHLLRKGVTWMI